MMGTSHAVSGMAIGALTLPLAPVADWRGQLAWVAAWGGFALLPDLDQGGITRKGVHGSSAARTWGPLTAGMAQVVGWIARGHRKGTHSLIGVAVIWLLAQLATYHPASTFFLVALAVGLALRGAAWIIPGRLEKTWPVNLVVSVGAAAWITTSGVSLDWLPLAVVGGCVAHILGDMLTPEGVPLLYPLVSRNVGVPLFTTGAWVETWVVALFGAAVAWGLYLAGLLDGVLTEIAWWVGDWSTPTLVLVVALVFGWMARQEQTT